MGDQCINAKPPATPRPTPHLAAPRPAQGLGWWQGEGGQGQAYGMGKGKGGKEKDEEKNIYNKKNPRVCKWHDLAGLGGCGSVSGCWAGGDRAGEQLCWLP